jgi:hypothetical protein
MKKLFFILLAGTFSLAATAQGNSGNKGKSKNNPTVQADNPGNSGNSGATGTKSKEKNKDKEKEDKIKKDEHDSKVWDGVSGTSGCGKASKNQPAKVRQNFQRDYPNAVNVRWTKCRGDWTATFGNGIFLSTAIYHANGDRRDTRTPINQDNIPRRVLDEIFRKRQTDTRIDDAIRIEVPNAVKEIFRIKNILEGKAQFEYYNTDGVKVEYNY